MGPPPKHYFTICLKRCILQWKGGKRIVFEGLGYNSPRWNVKRDVRASIGAYGGGNGAYERIFTEKMRF